MPERTFIARIRADLREPETLIVASPAVGLADGAPRPGVFLNPFDRLLTLKILGERRALRLPRDVQGRVVETFVPRAVTPVSFDEPLVRIDPRGIEAAASQARAPGAAAGVADGAEAEAAAAGCVVIAAPSQGIFYRRPSPDAPAYVETGGRIAAGAVLGLIEVMKCFNQITYGGVGLPEAGEVTKILADDAAEVAFGQPLFWVRPLG